MSKGSSPRPFSVDQETFSSNWEAAFGKKTVTMPGTIGSAKLVFPNEKSKLTILTDVDGVLLDWAAGFDAWMTAQGYKHNPGKEHAYLIDERFQNITHEESKRKIREFNESEAVGNLKPFRDAIECLSILESRGFRFGVISSHSNQPEACARREQNLRKFFGDVFDFFVHLPTGADKDDALEPYRNSGWYWVEDKTENAVAGAVRGLNTFLMDHEHNNTDQPENVTRVYNWNDIVNIILKG